MRLIPLGGNMQFRKTVTRAAAASAVLAASSFAVSANASADVNWNFKETCTLTVPGAAPHTFVTDLAGAYAGHGSLANGSVLVNNENVQIRVPADAYKMLAPFATKTTGTAWEYYTVAGKPAAAPFALSVPKSYTPATGGGQYEVSASGAAVNVPATAADVAKDGYVKLAHSGTVVKWMTDAGTATLSCGTIPAPKPAETTPSTTPSGTSTSTPSGTSTSTAPSTTKPSTPATPGKTDVPAHTGGPVATTTPAPGHGPKVDTGVEAPSNNAAVLGFGAAAAVAAAGGFVALKRRAN